jgi:hypothetical protein
MKKYILSAGLILGGLTAFSQITVERSSYAVAGDWFLIASDTAIDENTSNALKLAGANKSWDLTGWANRDIVDTTFFADGFTYPGAPAGCNLVSFERDPMTLEELPTYFSINNSALRVILEAGMTSGSGGTFKLMQFPSTMGTAYTDSSVNFLTTLASDFGLELPFIDSVKITYSLKANSVIDGYGKLKMDAGEFDVLRQNLNTIVRVNFMVRNTITGTYSSLPGFGDITENVSAYAWFSANGGYPLLTANSDTLGNISDIEFVLASSRGLSSGLNKVANQNGFRVYPNPAKETLRVEVNAVSSESASISVFDILGNEVINMSNIMMNKGLNQFPVDLSNVKPGVYFINFIQGEVKTSQRFVVE